MLKQTAVSKSMNAFSRVVTAASLLAVPLSTIGALSGCGKVIEELQAAQGSVSAFETASELSHTASVYTDSIRDITADTEEAYMAEASTRIYEALQTNFAGCVTPYPDDQNPATVGAQFNCTGESGLFSIVGTVEGTLTPTLQGLKVVGSVLELSANELSISGRPVTGTLTLDYTIATNLADLLMDFDVTDERTGTMTVGAEGVLEPATTCVTYNGALTTEATQFSSVVDVTSFERCQGACPSAGGKATATITDAKGEASLDIAFDGTAQAEVVSSRGRSFEVSLLCGQ